MTHTPCPQCREEHEPRPLSYDGFGVNSCGMYRDRIATFSKSVPEAQRKELGALWTAAPALYEALKALYEHCAMVHKHWGDNSNSKEADLAIKQGEEALRLAEGRKP